MATTNRMRSRPGSTVSSRLTLGAVLVAMAGVGLVGYGILFLIRNFVGFTELGLSPQQVGATPQQIRRFSPDLYEYVSHLHMAVSGLLIALGIMVVALAWYGIRRGQRWALWTVLSSVVVALVVTIPSHYAYGLGTVGHLGPIYLDALLLVIGTVVAYTALPRGITSTRSH